MEETQGSESSFAASLLNRLLSHHRHVQKEALREVLKVITTGLNAESFKIGQYKRILRIVSNYFVSDVDNGEERASYLRSILIAFVKVEAIVYSEEMSLVLKELLDDSTYTSVAYTRKLVELVLLVSSTGEASWVFPHLHNITFRFLMDPQGKPMDRKHWVQSKLQKISTEFVEKFANYCLSNANNTVVSMLVLQDIIVNADVKASIRQVIKDHLRKRLQGVASKLVPDPVNILWTSLLRSLSSEEWSTVETTEGFESLLLKSIKKSPESFSAPASFILSSISSDLNTSYLVQQGIVGLAIRMLKSEDLQVKNAGISILTNTYGRIKDSDAITLFVNQIVDSLNGKFPGVATVSIPLDHHKLAILTGAIAALSKGNKFCDKVQTSKAYSSSLATLKAYFEKEKDANLQLFAGVFLANVMKTVLVADDLSVELRNLLDYFFAELEKSVTVASSSLKSSILFFLSYALSADDNEVTAKTLSRFGTTSLNIVKETMKKSNFFSFDTILALHVLSTISQYEVSLHESIKLAKLGSVLTSSSSFLYHETFSHYLKRSANNQASSVIRSLQDGKVNDLSPAVMVSALTFRQYVQGVITVFLNGSIEDSTKVFGLLESSESSSAFYSSPIATVLENGVAVTAPKAATSLFSLLMLFAEELNLADVVREKISKTNFNKASLSLCFVSGLWNLVNTVDRDLISEHKQSLVNYKAIDESIVPTKTFAKSVTANKLRSSLLLILSLNDEVTIPASHACSLLAFTSFITAHPLVSVDNVNATKFWRYKLIPMLRNYFNNIARSISNDYKFAKSLIKMVNHTAFTSNHYNSAVGKTSLSLFSMFFLDDIIKRKSFNNMNLNQIFFSHFVADMSSQLEVISQQLSTFSEEEISVYLNPQAAIEKGVEDAKSKVSDSVPESSNADRKKAAPRSTRKGGFGNDVVEDRDWAEKIKKEKAAKMLNSVEASQGEVMTARVQEICQNVVGVLEQMKRLWTLLEGLILLDVTMARQFLFVILSKETVWSLLSSNLVGDNILASMKVIYKRILEESLIDSVEDFIASVRITYLTTNLLEEKELPNVILRTLRALQLCFNKTTANDVIQATTFFLCFPCIAKIIEIGNSEAVANAFSVLEKLLPTSDELAAAAKGKYADNYGGLRSKSRHILSCLLKLISRFPHSSLSADQLLIQVSLDCAPLQEEEWTILLGEQGMLNEEVKVRSTCIEAILHLSMMSNLDVVGNANSELETCTWLLQYDENDEVKEYARQLWAESNKKPTEAVMSNLIQKLSHPTTHVRTSAAVALAHWLKHYSQEDTSSSVSLFHVLKNLFVESIPLPQEDVPAAKATNLKAMMKKTPDAVVDEKLPLRVAIGKYFSVLAAEKIIPDSLILQENVLIKILEFLLEFGVTDASPEVRQAMSAAGVSFIANYGKENKTMLLAYLENQLSRKPEANENLTKFDFRYAAVVVLLGVVARHLEKNDIMVVKILEMQIEALKTPSENVQRTVSDCLGPLAQSLKGTELAEQTVEKLMDSMLNADSYGTRRGAAFGLSAMVKGLGIPCLKQHNVMSRLKDACQGGSISGRQGALFAFECMAERLGLLFEPYIAGIVDVLLASFSHSSDHVRVAAQGATKVIMAKLSAHGVKQMLSPIITTMQTNTAWKSRQEAIKMLGMMANCAPKQLAASLAQIVPTLVQASSDAHPKVKETAKSTMTEISAIIRNPEIAHLSPVLLAALGDPANRTKEALEALLHCEFMHSIDAPSLALVIPILGRALKDRGADLKRKASAITGNMISMVSEPKALSPYLTTVVPGLKDCLLDPIPDVRASGAKALGTLYNGIGESEQPLQDVLSWLLNTLKSHDSPVERSGAAQGLAEICGSSSDAKKKDSIIQWVLGYKKDVDNAAREGLMWFLSFLPYTLKERFAEYISSSLPVILQGLSDDNEGVREVSMRAGKVIVSVLGMNHAAELAPSLMLGFFEEDWRIRVNSLQLLGDLLFLIGDAKATNIAVDDDDEDEYNFGGSSTRVLNNIKTNLGTDLSESVLVAIYILRSDIAISVRQHSLQIWKAIVSNTPRTLVEVMPKLIAKLVEQLSSDVEDLRVIAGRAIGELVMKLGDKVLPAIVRPLQDGLHSEKDSTRLGVCLGLTEVLSSCTKKQAEEYIDSIIGTVKLALCDSSEEVSAQAAKSFMILYRTVGNIAVDEIVPALLQSLAQGGEQADLALHGLKEMVSQRPRDMLEYLLPMFVTSPMQVVSAKALSSVVEVAGQHVHHHFGSLIPTLILELYQSEDKIEVLKQVKDGEQPNEQKIGFEEQRLAAIKTASASVMGAINDIGVHSFVSEIGKQIDHDSNIKRRKWGCWFAEQFFTHCKADFSEYLPILLKFILARVADVELYVLHAVKDALAALATSVSLEELIDHIDFMKNCISSTASAARHKTSSNIQISASGDLMLPLLSIPKSFDPFLTIFLHGLMNGSTTIREISADMIGDLAKMCTMEVLKPILIKAVGPLIRVIGERYPSSVKSSILKTLVVLMERGGPTLKAFAPQLQTTFVKSLSDPMREVRNRGGQALGKLMQISLRVDPLLTELTTLCMQADSNAIRHSILEAIISVMALGGDKATAPVLEKVKNATMKNLYDEDDPVRNTAAKCLGSIACFFNEAAISDVILDLLGDANSGGMSPADEPWSLVCGRVVALAYVVHSSGSRSEEFHQEVFNYLQIIVKKDDRISTKIALASAIGILLSFPEFIGSADRKGEFKTIAQSTIHGFAAALTTLAGPSGTSSDIRAISMGAIRKGAKNVYGACAQYMGQFFPVLIQATKDIDLRVKYSAERAMWQLCEGPTPGTSSMGSNIFQQYLTRADAESQKFLKDYYNRILSKMTTADSDEE